MLSRQLENIRNKIIPKTRSHAYVRYFNSDKIKIIRKILMSNYLLGDMEIINQLQIPDDSYILQVVYNKEAGGDAQLFITGRVENAEDPKESAIRELAEETRFELKNKSDMKYVNTYSKSVNWYTCPINSLSYVGIIDQSIKTGRPYNGRKITCVVHGEKEEMIKTMMSFQMSLEKGNDDIAGLVCMKFSDVRNVANEILKHGKFDHVNLLKFTYVLDAYKLFF